jgi:hypothetical protein
VAFTAEFVSSFNTGVRPLPHEAVKRHSRLPPELVVGFLVALQDARPHEEMEHLIQRVAERVVRPEHPLDFEERSIPEQAQGST